MPQALTPRLIGQTEKTMNAILDRILAERVTEPEWVALVLVAGGSDEPVGDPNQVETIDARVAAALKTDRQVAAAILENLAGAGLIEYANDFQTTMTARGRQLIEEVRTETGTIVQRLWGDLPTADLDATARVLTTALERAEHELASRQ
jgi:hypothetical protein